MRYGLFVILVAGLAFRPATAVAALALKWIPDRESTNRVVVEAEGVALPTIKKLQQSELKTAQWQQILAIFAEQGDLTTDLSVPPMLGTYQTLPNAIRFTPAFPLTKGITYRAVLRPQKLPGGQRGQDVVTSVFKLQRPQTAPSTIVAQVYPSVDVVPENLLKFYIHFSAPMSGGHIYEHIHLINEHGKEVELPFLELDEELWDRTMTRLTLFIDPGRIKREVRPLEEIGPSLEEGKAFTLRIDPAWRDAEGTPLQKPHEKRFRVGPADREPPDPAQWKVHPAKSGSREPLVVQFPKPMDHALALRVMRVLSQSGAVLRGTTALGEKEQRWTFVPDEPWKAGAYKITVESTIEDLAGNNIGKRFEVDLFEPVQRRMVAASSEIPFQVR